MPKIYETQLSKKLIKRMLNHGLEISLSFDPNYGKDSKKNASYPDGRMDDHTIWVGIDKPLPSIGDEAGTINQLVSDYCRDALNCDMDDIVWALVEKTEDNGVRYKVVDSSGCWNDEKYSFIYMTKEHALDHYNTERLSLGVLGDIRYEFVCQILEFNAWTNNEVLKATVTPKQKVMNTPIDFKEGIAEYIMPVNDEIDVFSGEAICGVLFEIDNGGAGTVNLSLLYDRGMPTEIQKSLYFIRNMEHVFGFTPALGSMCHDVRERQFNFNMSLDCMPHFSALKESTIKSFKGDKSFNLIDNLQKYVDFLSENGEYSDADKQLVAETIAADKPYREWSHLLINALMLTLCEVLEVMSLSKVSLNGETEIYNYC